MGDLGKRLISAFVFGPIIVLLFIILAPKPFFLFMGIVLIMAAYEFSSMAKVTNVPVITLLIALGLIPLYVGISFYPLWLLFSPAAYLAFKVTARGPDILSFNREIGRSLAVLVLAEVFLALPLFFLYGLKEIDRLLPLILLLTIWASDTGAYLIGKTAGRHKIAPLISPKKTYEGLLGAVAGAVLVALLFRGRLGVTLRASVAMGCAIGLFGQLGDILESIAKRVYGVKDSSHLIPGHGGLLDRIDSFLLTAPFLYYYLLGVRQ